MFKLFSRLHPYYTTYWAANKVYLINNLLTIRKLCLEV